MAERHGLPEPILDERNRPFLQGASDLKLLLPRCSMCGKLMAPPIANCIYCLSSELEWIEARGTGSIYTFIEYHKAWIQGFEPYIPYIVAVIELDEGIRLVSDLLVEGDDQVSVGDSVRVAFENRGEERVPVFVKETQGNDSRNTAGKGAVA